MFLSWSDDDQDKALAFERAKSEVCACGTRMAEWEENRFAYIVDTWTCPACEILEMEDDNIPKDARGVKKRLLKNGPDVETSDGIMPVG